MFQHIRSRIIWGVVAAFTLFTATVALVALLFPGGRNYNVSLVRDWAGSILRFAGVKYEGIGLEKIPEDKPCIFIANHQSVLDIPVTMSLLPGRVRMMTKRSLFRIPIFGWLLSLEDFVPVDRNHREKARLSLTPAERLLEKGSSVFVFPEGTRSRTGEIGFFKTGAFRLAVNTGVPVIPLAIIGAERILPPKRRLIKRGKILMVVGDPIETTGLTIRDRLRLRDETRAWIIETKEHYDEVSD